MDKVYSVCNNCVDRHCCRGLCKEMNDYLVKKREDHYKKSLKMDSKSGIIKSINKAKYNLHTKKGR